MIIKVGTPDSSVEVFRGGTLPDDTNPSNSKKDSEQESSKKDKKNNENSQASEESETNRKKNSGSYGIQGADGFTPLPNILNRPRSKPVPQNPGSVNSDQNPRSQDTSLEMSKKKISSEEVILTLSMAPEDSKKEVICGIEIPALMRYAQETLKDPTTNRDLVHFLEQFRKGNLRPGLDNRSINTAGFLELRARNAARVYLKVEPEKILVKAVSNKKKPNAGNRTNQSAL